MYDLTTELDFSDHPLGSTATLFGMRQWQEDQTRLTFLSSMSVLLKHITARVSISNTLYITQPEQLSQKNAAK